VNGLVVGSHAGFLEGFTESGVSVASSSNVFSGSSVFHAKHSFCNHLSSVGPNDMDAKDLVSLFVSEDLDQAIRSVVGPGSAVSIEGEDSFTVRNT
jgi:hypothetical protein